MRTLIAKVTMCAANNECDCACTGSAPWHLGILGPSKCYRPYMPAKPLLSALFLRMAFGLRGVWVRCTRNRTAQWQSDSLSRKLGQLTCDACEAGSCTPAHLGTGRCYLLAAK
eukprot:COSAG01_NODE_16425_length_1237_cov_1.265378_2_plen_113_part_00